MTDAPLYTYRAAGGIVLDDAARVLLIERWVLRDGEPRHEIRLPKGHVEPGETDEQAALRETCEETGYCALEVIADLGESVTEFAHRRGRVQRTEHYFLMRLLDPQRSRPHFDDPDDEEALFEPLWAAGLDDAEARLTYPSEKAFAARASALRPGSSVEEAM